MIGWGLLFLGLALWERPNLAEWSPAERRAFWAAWALVAAWGAGLALGLHLPDFPSWTLRLFRPWSARLLTPQPDPFW